MKLRKFALSACLLATSILFASCSLEVPASGYYPQYNISVNGGDLPETKEDTAVNGNKEGLLPVDKVFELTAKNALTCAGYDKQKFFTPFYDSQVQYAEGFFLLENERGGIDDVALAFPIGAVLEVRSNDLRTLYREGKDYTVKNGNLSFPAGSAITALSRSAFFRTGGETAGQWRYSGDSRTVANTTGEIYPSQYVCTYVRTSEYKGAEANRSGGTLSKFRENVALKKGVEILLLGDSIAAGAGGSGNFPMWANMVEEGVAYYSDGEAKIYNAAQPGIHSAQYVSLIDGKDEAVGGGEEFLKSAKEKFALAQAHKKDVALAIIAIGANDAGGWCDNGNGTSTVSYEENVRRMISYVREENADCSILLVSCMQTNPKLIDASNDKIRLCAVDLAEYEKTLEKIATSETGVAVANVYSVQNSLLKRKKIEDMLGDNVNHPSDYMSRVYAQVILDSLFGK